MSGRLEAAASTIIPFAALETLDAGEWDGLAAAASEPNPFAERWFVLPAARHLAPPADARMLVVRERGELIGLMPVTVMPRYGRTRVRHVENWLHFNAFFGAPLVRRGRERAFWAGALALLDADGASPAFLHVTTLDGEGPLGTALLATRPDAAVVHRSERALLASTLTRQAYYETHVRKKKRKEIGRLQCRLAELGAVSMNRLSDGDEIDAWIDAFLTLEASGWKGRDGAALANDPATAAFTRAALHGAYSAGRLQMLRLDLDDAPIAMLVNFLTPPGSFSFKIAFDEDYARFSPGVLISLENLDLLGDPAIDWMDSCAAPDHPMINSLWAERRQLVRITVPLTGWRRRLTFSACRMLEKTSARLRELR